MAVSIVTNIYNLCKLKVNIRSIKGFFWFFFLVTFIMIFFLFGDMQAPFPNSGYMNGYSSSGNYKANSSSVNTHAAMTRNRYVQLWYKLLVY